MPNSLRAPWAASLALVVAVLALVACGSSDIPGGAEGADGSLPGDVLEAGGTTDAQASGAADATSAGHDASSSGGDSGLHGDAGLSADAGSAPHEAGADAGGPAIPGAPCGYKNQGVVATIATDIEICLPPVVCTPSETCPRGLGDCVGGKCVFQPGYQGLATLPQAWTTEYCDLTTGSCNGAVIDPLPADVATSLSATYGPVCADAPGTTGTCVGIAAPPPLMAGNSQVAIDPATGKEVALWGLGMTAASGLCYELTGAGGTAVVAITDRCAGYCECGATTYNECGNCINATDTTTECPCVGTAPPLYGSCCGRTCGATQQCDWCANNNHPHFDLDNATFQHVCGSAGPMYGSCQLTKVKIVANCYPPRPSWPN
jgi:hypothetical protein